MECGRLYCVSRVGVCRRLRFMHLSCVTSRPWLASVTQRVGFPPRQPEEPPGQKQYITRASHHSAPPTAVPPGLLYLRAYEDRYRSLRWIDDVKSAALLARSAKQYSAYVQPCDVGYAAIDSSAILRYGDRP